MDPAPTMDNDVFDVDARATAETSISIGMPIFGINGSV